jgi:hypothetical protein
MSPSVRGLTGIELRRSIATAVVVCMCAVGLVPHVQQTQAAVIATERMALGSSHTCVINNDNTV